MERVNPATGETIDTVESHTDAEVDEMLEAAHERYLSWRDVEMHERCELLASTRSLSPAACVAARAFTRTDMCPLLGSITYTGTDFKADQAV